MPKSFTVAKAVSGVAIACAVLVLLYRHIAWVSTISLTCILATSIYRLFLHPLSSIPGPRLAALSNVWYAYHARNGLVGCLARTLHESYGPMVRVGPNEVWFNSKAAFKAIYSSGSGYEKSDFYLATALVKPELDWLLRPSFTKDTLDLLSERDMKRYRLQRRLIGPIYRPGSVSKYQPAVDAALRRAVSKLQELNGAEVDLKEWMHMIVVECLGAAVLSWSPGMVNDGTDWGTSKHSYLGWRRKSVLGLFPLIAKLEINSKSIGRAFSIVWGVTFAPPENFRTFFPSVTRQLKKKMKAASRDVIGDDLAADLISLHKDKPDFTDVYVRKMVVTNFGAGHETMASTLTSLMAMIGSRPDVQSRLSQEIRHDGSSTHEQLSYLHAVIKECKRLHPVVAMSLPRTVPAPGVALHGLFFPGGTTVGCSPVSLHRNQDICGPEPAAFKPDRWLDDEERVKTMDMYSLSWGGGARSCPGRHLAEMIVWEVCLAIFREFDVEVTKKADDTMPVYFLSMMTGVRARFIPITQG